MKCSHGATIGQLDEDAIFYLRSRGIGSAAARQVLTRAFAGEVVERIRLEPLRVQPEDSVGKQPASHSESSIDDERDRRECSADGDL